MEVIHPQLYGGRSVALVDHYTKVSVSPVSPMLEDFQDKWDRRIFIPMGNMENLACNNVQCRLTT